MTNQPRPRILQVSTVAGTLRRFITPIAKHFRKLGYEVDGAAKNIESNEKCLNAFDNCYEVPFSRSMFSIQNLTSGSNQIRQVVENGNYDIVHVHTPIASFMTRRIINSMNHRPKVVYTAHGFHFYDGLAWPRKQVFRFLEMKASPWMDHLVVMNKEDHEAALTLGIASPETITFMHGIGIDLDEFSLAPSSDRVRHEIRQQLGISKDDTFFLMLAGFNSGKRHEDAINALGLLQHRTDMHLVLAGRGHLLEKCRRLAGSLGISERVHFVGYRSDVVDLIAASDSLLLVSLREGLPRSIMEALSMGKTVIGTNIRGISDLLGNNCGILVPVKSPQRLADAMQKAIKFTPDPSAVADVIDRCSLNEILVQHEVMYDNLLSR